MKWSASVCLFWHILHLKQRIWLHSQKQLVKPWRYSAFPLYTLQHLWSAAPFLTHFLQMISFVCIRAGLTMALITFWHSTYILKWGELQWNSFKWDMMHLIGCVFTVFVGGGAPPPLCSHHLSSVNDQHMHSLLCGLWINTHYHESVCGVSVLLYICAQLSSNNGHLKCGLKHQKHQKWAERVQLWTSTQVPSQSAHCLYNSFRFNEGVKHFTIILLLILSNVQACTTSGVF